jgi:hypothetical protein
VEREGKGWRVLTFAVFVDGAGFGVQDGVRLPPGRGEGPFEAAMAEAVKRLRRDRGLFRGNTCLYRVAGAEWLSPGEDRGGVWGTGVRAEPEAATDSGGV